METQLQLHFLKFNIQSHSLEVAPWLECLYAPNDLSHDFPDQSVSLTLQIESKDSPHALAIAPLPNGVFAETNLCTGRCYYADGRFYSASDTEFWHEMDYDVERNLIRANVGGKFLETGQWVISNFLRPILQSFILPFYGLKTLHGAVLHKNGRTVFLSGGAGMGKSTTTLQFIEAGWDVLSDDGPFFFLQDNQSRVLASLDYLHVTENTLNMFPQFGPFKVGGLDSRDKYALRRQMLQQSDAWRSPHTITDFVELRRGDFETPRLVPGDRGSAFRFMFNDTMIIFRHPALQEGPLSARRYSEFIFKLVTSVLQNARIHQLEYANHHLKQLPELLEG
ncbi:hypothetical protein IAD21_05287 [Abditibacteriota bacterium]|nr:hypothetical protein IAD21_05287 [Abditibacteriota bacterium]